MSKNFITRLIIVIAFLVAAVLYLLSELVPDTFGWFNLAWAGLIFSAACGISFLIRAIFIPNSTTLKKLTIIASSLFCVIAVVCLISALALPENIILPAILVVVAAGLVLGLFITGGKKWDEGDNHKVGYKNYYQRKKQEQKNEQQQASCDNDDGEQ